MKYAHSKFLFERRLIKCNLISFEIYKLAISNGNYHLIN